jgi:hypothetical protein
MFKIKAKVNNGRGWIAQMRRGARSIMLLAFVFAGTGYGQQLAVDPAPRRGTGKLTADGTGAALVFGKYLASIQERNPFTEGGPVGVEIEASLPGLGKQGRMQAVRQVGGSERSEYSEGQFDGDSTIKHQVIGRYLAAEGRAEELPYSSVAVTPANYKFRYVGSVETGETAVYVFHVAPKKKRTGSVEGELWINSETGIAIHQAGRLVKRPSVFIRRIEFARDTKVRDGLPSTRVTRVVADTRMVGRAELTVTERPLQTENRGLARLTQQDAQ